MDARTSDKDRIHYLDDSEPGIRRIGAGNGFYYRNPSGQRIVDRPERDRIHALAIPPAYADVWISPDPGSHLQATGRDNRGRKQYIYHPGWLEIRTQSKFEEIVNFAEGLSRLRSRVDRDLRSPRLSRRKVLGSIVWLLDNLLIRVGNERYARQNGSFGLTTLHKRHLEITGSQLRFRFNGKSGKVWNLRHTDRRISRIVRKMHELRGQRLFKYQDEDGEIVPVTSGAVNDYLRSATESEVTSRQFRTWAGTVLAAGELVLGDKGDGSCTANLNSVLDKVANRLNNTRSVCRSSYVHPRVISDFEAGTLKPQFEECFKKSRSSKWMSRDERAVLKWLQQS